MKNNKGSLNYISELDGIRGTAILMVILWHYIGCELWEWGESNESGSRMMWIKILFEFKTGVDMFFVLSGFLITRILLENKGSKNYFSVFYRRRIFRIFPIYYLVVLCYAFFKLSGLYFDESKWLFQQDSEIPLQYYFIYFQNWFYAFENVEGPHFLNATWSLCIEEHFYLLFPMIVWGLKRNTLKYLCILVIIGSPILRSFLTWKAGFCFLFGRMDSLMMGALISIIISDARVLDYFRNNRIYFMFTFLALGFVLLGIYSWLPAGETGTTFLEFYKIIKHTLFAVLYGLLLFIVLSSEFKWLNSFFNFNILKSIGVISYGIYIYHMIVLGIFHDLIRDQPPRLRDNIDLLITIAAFLTTLLIAKLSHRYFEKPLIAIGRKVKYKSDQD